jgi:hypothetical protein
MKKSLVLMIFSLAIALGASAQHFRGGGGHYYSRPRVSGGVGVYAPVVPYYGYGFGYSPFYPYAQPFYVPHRPTKLELNIEDIKNDYQDRIWSARHDDSLSKKARRQKVHELKHERDQAIIDAKRNYYKKN